MRVFTLILIRIYQLYLSPLMPGVCRYRPTCSQYMLQAVRKYGFQRGVLAGLKRIGRCHPFHPGGYDPVD